jgi:MFS family permease
MNKEAEFTLYPKRWLVLAVFMLINLVIQVLWISYAPITTRAAGYFGVSEQAIGFLAMSFMIAFLPLSIPVSWLIDTLGFKIAVGIGAVMMGVFSITRGLAGQSYTWVLISTIGLAAAQPFLMNAWTKAGANWFGMRERTTAVGLIILANLIGTALGTLLPPIMVQSMSIPQVQLTFGYAAAASALLFLIFAGDKPKTAPCPPEMAERSLMLEGLVNALKQRGFWLYVIIWFLGMGIFNGITTWVEGIIRPRGFTELDAGTLGAMLILGGLVGAVLIPIFSDRTGKRIIFLRIGMVCAIPGLVGVTFAQTPLLLFFSAFLFGFFFISTSPIGMQYIAEVTYPTPEGTSNGLIQLFGQLSVVFVYIMEALKRSNGDFMPAMLVSLGLLVISAGVTFLMKDTN